MEKPYGAGNLTVEQYLRMPESLSPTELVWGVVRESPVPTYGHQDSVTRLAAMVYGHVWEHGLGKVCVSPVDVVLDREKALVVQPDIIFVAAPRLDIIGSRVWGAPDLVVEVLSAGTARRDRTTKTNWCREYGVRECWLVDAGKRTVEVVRFDVLPDERCLFEGDTQIVSHVLPSWTATAESIFY